MSSNQNKILSVTNTRGKVIYICRVNIIFNQAIYRGRCSRDCIVVGFTTTYSMISEPIKTNVMSLNPSHGEAYSIQHYVIKFVSDS